MFVAITLLDSGWMRIHLNFHQIWIDSKMGPYPHHRRDCLDTTILSLDQSREVAPRPSQVNYISVQEHRDKSIVLTYSVLVLIFPRCGPLWGIHRSPVDSPHHTFTMRGLIFCLLLVWTICCTKSYDVSHLRRHRAYVIPLLVVFVVSWFCQFWK